MFACSGLGTWLLAQSLSSSVIAAAGEESFSAKLSLQWTLGELAVDYLPVHRGIISEGFHQPLLESTEISSELFTGDLLATSARDQFSNGYRISLWPNPVRTILTVQIESDHNEVISIELLDLLGRKLLSTTNHRPNEWIELDFSAQPAGIYLLKFFKQDGTLIKTLLSTKH